MQNLKPRSFCVLILLVGLASQARPQGCCSIELSSLGTPTGLPIIGTMRQEQLLIGLSQNFTDISKAIQTSRRVTDPENRSTFIHRTNVEFAYGITPRFSIHLSGGIVGKARTLTVSDEGGQPLPVRFSASGMSDISLRSRLVVVPFDFVNKKEAIIGIGVKLPTGSYQRTQDNALLPIDMQPGTGGYGFILDGYYLKRWTSQPLIFFTNTSLLLNTKNPTSYQMGHKLDYNVGIGWERFSSSLFLQFKGRYATPDRYTERVLFATGGLWAYIAPAIHVNWPTRFSTVLSVDLPVFQNVNGLQITPAFGLSGLVIYDLGHKRP